MPLSDPAAVEAAAHGAADALVLRFGDATGPARRAARQFALDLLWSAPAPLRQPLLFVRLDGLDGPDLADDLAAVAPGRPDGILLGKARGGADVQHLGAKLGVAEAEHGLPLDAIAIIAEAGGCAAGLFGLGSYASASPRLMGLSWSPEGLAADLGGHPAALDIDRGPLATAQHLTLFAARAAALPAIDTVSSARTGDAFLAECRRARQDGFAAKFATTTAQVETVNAVFGHDGVAR